jgi:4-hydroxy-3-polyprenylbenzoate decarboxylase
MLAGFLRKKKVELVKCLTQPAIEVPADADFIIEGYVDPAEDPIWEGPFGDHTGYYSLPDWYPRFHITAITHRKKPVYPATIVGIPPQEDAWLGKATERIFLAPIKMTLVPEIIDMEMPVEGVFHNLVIAKIAKAWAGQAQKVMNAMWGAGQMMFNKILIITDESAEIRDYPKLAKHIFRNFNPASDAYFSQGPMDVLDHSCSKLGFGGKMCIDGTAKTEEESDARYEWTAPMVSDPTLDLATLQHRWPEIHSINSSLLAQGIPCLILGVKKNRPGHIRELHEVFSALPGCGPVKLILYVEHTVDAGDLSVALWRFCNNLDPKRDHILAERPAGTAAEPVMAETRTAGAGAKLTACLGLDGTRKTAAFDNFHRDWPNIIVADDATIRSVDEKWAALGLGPFLSSPSLKFKDQLYGTEAVVS